MRKMCDTKQRKNTAFLQQFAYIFEHYLNILGLSV